MRGLGVHEHWTRCGRSSELPEVMNDCAVGIAGVYLDIGANNAEHLSNTFMLDKHGWNGWCVVSDPENNVGIACHSDKNGVRYWEIQGRLEESERLLFMPPLCIQVHPNTELVEVSVPFP